MARKARPSCPDMSLCGCFVWMKSEIEYAWATSSARIGVDDSGTSDTSSEEARMSDGTVP